MRNGKHRKYAGVLDIPARKSGKVEIRHIHHPAGTVMRSDNLRTMAFGQKGEELKFPVETVWHELSETGRGVWMTDLPIEQRQTDELIVRAKGRVLVGGLGLGYAVVALAARPSVSEIVVVEKNPHVIELVWAATRKRVREVAKGRPLRLKVVEADLFQYLERRQAKRRKGERPEFDWGLFDIWQQDGESCFHETVVPLRKLAHRVVRSLVNWNEDVMRGQLYNGLRTRLMMLSMSAEKKAEMGTVMMSLDDLTKDSDSIYRQWAVPFWRWYRDHAQFPDGTVDTDLVNMVMEIYVRNYGRPEGRATLTTLKIAA